MLLFFQPNQLITFKKRYTIYVFQDNKYPFSNTLKSIKTIKS